MKAKKWAGREKGNKRDGEVGSRPQEEARESRTLGWPAVVALTADHRVYIGVL